MSLTRSLFRTRWLLVLVALLIGLATLILRPPISAAGRTYYVSRNGSNGDGTSWATAWNELSRINWSVVQPGDTILIDGGSVACPALGPGYNCGMVYNSTLSINARGTSSAPITIRLASDPGRNGTVIIDGGLTQWSGCSGYASEPKPPAVPNGAGVREVGVTFGSSQWVILDGTKWGGIEVRNHSRFGVNFSSGQYVTGRYLKVHHNTHPTDTSNHAVGVTQGWQAQHVTLSRSEIFRNGQDATRGAGDYFTLEENYLHDHYCNHPDGVQAFVPTSNSDVPDNAGEIRGTVIRRNIFDNIGLQSVFMGENGSHQSWVVDATIHDNLFVNGAFMIKSKHGSSTNWNIYNNTFYNASNFAIEWCCANPGARAPMTIRNNIFSRVREGGSAFYLPTGGGNTTFANNCLHRTGGRAGNVAESGTVFADPQFVDASGGNFALRSGSGCAGKGSSITSVAQLLGATGFSTTQANPTEPPAKPTSTQVSPTATQPPPTNVPPTATSVPPTNEPPAPTNVPPTNPPEPTAGPEQPPANPVVLNLEPAADAFVDASKPKENQGRSIILRTHASPEQRSYLRFDVQGLNGQPVTRVLLKVYANGSSPVGFRVQAVSDNNWQENEITWKNAPALGEVLAESGKHGGGRWVEVDITGYITGDGTYTLALTTDSSKAVSYPSRNADNNRPVLVIETVGGVTRSSAREPLMFLP